MRKILLLIFILLLNSIAFAQFLQTYFELSQYRRTPRYDSTLIFCNALQKKSNFIRLQSIGKSHEGRDIPLIIAASNGEFTYEKAKKSKKNIVLIQACIHPGESDGKDAGLLLFRDFIYNKDLYKLLEHNIILFLPILNVDGHERFSAYNRINQVGPIEMGWRTNALNLNLNRDYIKAQSIEIKHWLKLFHQWKPHFFIDCHTTNGADYQYPITYALEIFGNMDSSITQWQKNVLIPQLHQKMDSAGYPIFRYVAFRNWYDFESGLTTWITPPSLSQGYTALVNCPGLLIESHMLKDYKTRVLGTYEMIKNCLIIISKEKETLQKFAYNVKQVAELPVAFKQTNDSILVPFKGYEYTVQKSDLSGGKWFIYTNIPKDYYLPMFDSFVPSKIVKIPEYYIIPVAWANFYKEYFQLHNISYKILEKDVELECQYYRFSNVKLSSTSYESCQRVSSYQIETITRKTKFLKGSLLVYTNQPNYRILVHLIEPEAPASLFAFGFFNSIFEQKEYGEQYILEPLARKMLENDIIRMNFEEFKKNNPNASSYEILNWFYNRSEYADPWLNVYPIGKIFKNN